METSTINYGYCCVNLTLQQDKKITCSRGIKKATFIKNGLEACSRLALLNVLDLKALMQWNIDNNVKLFRISSSMFPWMSEYELADLQDYYKIRLLLSEIGNMAKDNGIRLTMHPGAYVVIASPSERIVQNSFKELRQHAEQLDMLGMPETLEAPINIHINGVYGDKIETGKRFMQRFDMLPANVKNRLTIENDDKQGQWSISDLTSLFKQYNIRPAITFDYLHHACHPDNLSEQDAIKASSVFWKNHRQLVHYSSSKQVEIPSAKQLAHADYIHENIITYNLPLDIELEAKAKELALIQYINRI